MREDIVAGGARVVSVRMTASLIEKITAAAERKGQTLSDFMRSTVRAKVESPIGWRCAHVNVTSIAGVLFPFSAPCGCEPVPVFDASEVMTGVRSPLAY